MPERDKLETEAESRRILRRVAQEADSSGFSTGMGTTAGAGKDDPRRTDPIEYWGTRIGRTIGLLIGIGLTIWLVVFILYGE